MYLARFDRIGLGHFPTPLERLDNLTRRLAGPEIWIKRDDCTGLAGGGNKTRKLEFLVADALSKGADTLVTQGATQSNHVRQTAAAARRARLQCHALLERRVSGMGDDYERGGNVLLDELLHCTYEFRPEGTDMNAEGEACARRLREAGHRPYFIPGGGSTPIGALGYARCGAELVGQIDERGLRVDAIVHATGSAGTQAGLLAGLHAMSAPLPVIGVSVRAPRARQAENVHRLARATLALMEARDEVPSSSVEVEDGFVGPGYGRPTPEMVEAIAVMAGEEGILLDPVYSGKGFAGLIDMIARGVFTPDQRVVFVHTGGAPALFAYSQVFSREAAA